MAADCNRRNPLLRSGTNQAERFLPALKPGHIRLDERSPADLILFAQRFSRHMKHYRADNQLAGDWLPFFNLDVTAILAGLSNLPAVSFLKCAGGLEKYLAVDPGPAPADILTHARHFKLLFYLPLLLLREAGEHYARLPQDHALKTFMVKVLAQDAKSSLEDFLGYYKGALALAEPIFDETPVQQADYNISFKVGDPRPQLPTVVSERLAGAPSLANLKINPDFIQGVAPAGWDIFYAAIQADTSPYEDSLGSSYKQIYDALHYNLLTKAAAGLFQAAQRLAREAAKYLDQTLSADNGHTPHYGLWLAFLKLFKLNQDHLNGMTGRHLNYYLKEVLQLGLRGAEPDKVHLVFELNKNQAEHLLPAASTFFKAGKDKQGKEVQYRLDYDFVVNRARVESLKSLYRHRFNLAGIDFYLPYAAPVADSRDGQGEELPKDDPAWKPFGPVSGGPNARIGFALADKRLFLREGQRTIKIKVEMGVPLPGVFIPGFRASLTTPDGWLEVKPEQLDAYFDTEENALRFQITLSGDDPPIIPYDPAVHGEGYGVSKPMVRIEFNFSGDPVWSTVAFTFLRDLRFKALSLKTEANDQRNLTLQNEQGMIDPAKPFLPFGPAPAVKSSLILGSSQLFSQKLAQVILYPTWDQTLTAEDFFLKTGPQGYQVKLWYLKDGAWTENGEFPLFPGTGGINLTNAGNFSQSAAQTLKDEPYTASSPAGFIKLELEKDFGHKAYLDEKTLTLIEISLGKTLTQDNRYNYDQNTMLPKEPYTPKITEFKLTYTTAAAAPEHLFHLYPFGFKKAGAGDDRLFPGMPNEGELYLGVKDLAPPQRLSLLFQTVDGSANPLKEENSLSWAYLSGDEWKDFSEADIDDKTDNLTGSGIVGLAVPEEADTRHTLLPSGLHWLRLSVAQDADALNDLLRLEAQAAPATFMDRGNDPNFLATPLPAGTISKFTVSDAAVKKISQPYASFGGKPRETDEHFYLRASERLRHKDRAATMWDYEHLVLEHFPQVYKVKCINHTGLYRDKTNNILADNELSPGQVLVVPIPYLKGKGAVNPLRPYTDKKTLVAIDRFLRERLSPFVQLEVQNPKIEEVQVKFSVGFTSDIADISFYKKALQEAIIRFLSPWAYDEGAEISFGGRWHKAAIINFVEEQSYVDYVKDFEMYHKADITQVDAVWKRRDEEVAEATTSRSILVSHSQHFITQIS